MIIFIKVFILKYCIYFLEKFKFSR